MKVMKKFVMLLVVLCITTSNFMMLTYAADGKIMFTDPSTTVGETLEVMGVLQTTDGTSIEDRTIDMTYDINMLKFKEGSNVTENAPGQLTYEVIGQQDGTRVEFEMYFDVLREGTTKIEVEGYNAWNTSSDPINCEEGFSTIVIAAGDGVADEPVEVPSDAVAVEVGGVSYRLSSEFAKSDIPDGYVEATLSYDGVEHKVIQSEKSGLYLGYLVDADMIGDFFVYVEDNATFAPYAEISVSDLTSIVLLSNIERIRLPEDYVLTTVTVNEKDFPAWQNAEKNTMYILYALNSMGEAKLYQYDSLEGTYQQFEAPQVIEEDTSFMGKLTDVLQNHLDYVILGTGIGFIVFVIVIIILSVKLYNRNAELDELYDEYGIDLDDEEDTEKSVKKNNEADDEFIYLDETEDDVMIEEADLSIESLEEDVQTEEEEDLEIDVAFLEESILESEAEEDEDVEVSIEDNGEDNIEDSYYDEDEVYSDFEIDFIDLDD